MVAVRIMPAILLWWNCPLGQCPRLCWPWPLRAFIGLPLTRRAVDLANCFNFVSAAISLCLMAHRVISLRCPNLVAMGNGHLEGRTAFLVTATTDFLETDILIPSLTVPQQTLTTDRGETTRTCNAIECPLLRGETDVPCKRGHFRL